MNRKFKIIKNCLIGIIVLAIVSFAAIEALIINSARIDEGEKVDYVIVLGAGLRGEQLSLTLYNRLSKAVTYLNQYPEAKVIVSGGQGPGEYITEAEAMKRFLMKNKINENRIIKEDKSTSTFENLLYSRMVLEERSSYSDNKIIIVTCDFHMFRAKFLATRLGFNPYGYPSPSVSYLRPYYYSREYLAVFKSFLFDFEKT